MKILGQYLFLISQKIKVCTLHIGMNNAIKHCETITEWKTVQF
jgi:hypothetical protein